MTDERTSPTSRWINGRQVLSGAMHYFRIHPDLWRDRIGRLAAMGANTLETYVAWNFHELRPGEVDFTRWRDLGTYITMAAEAGLDVIVRPGPYICAEWEGGGLPAWLMFDGPMALRTSDPAYLAAISRWLDVLLPVLVPLQSSQGGPVIAMQVENEYGSFGTDAAYLDWLVRAFTERGVDVPLFTSDGPNDFLLCAGTLPEAEIALNLMSDAPQAMALLEERRPGAPFFCAEYYAGWFDHWGERHHTLDVDSCLEAARDIVEAGASLNIYMAHGGTNFGLWAGANALVDGEFDPTASSYDFDAPIAEDGTLTPKFWALRELFESVTGVPAPAPPQDRPRQRPQSVRSTALLPLLDVLRAASPDVRTATCPLSQDELHQTAGLTLYEARVHVPRDATTLRVLDPADRAYVFVDGDLVAITDRNEVMAGVPLADGVRDVLVSVLVENHGRVGYGPLMGERKGLRGGVVLCSNGVSRFVHGWEHRFIDPMVASACPTDWVDQAQDGYVDAAAAGGAQVPPETAGLHRATVHVDVADDAFVELPGWGKGYLWLNGFLVGRYWERGPQRTLYVPAPLWRDGDNELVLLELETAGESIEIRDAPDLGPTRR